MLGVCYGAQFMAHFYGGEVAPSNTREYGRANLGFIESNCSLFKNVNLHSQVWMSHGDTIVKLPKNFKVIASTEDVNFETHFFKILIIHKPSYGSREVPHKTWANSVQPFLCLLDTKNKQIIKNHANHYFNKNVLIPKITLDPNLRLFTVKPSK